MMMQLAQFCGIAERSTGVVEFRCTWIVADHYSVRSKRLSRMAIGAKLKLSIIDGSLSRSSEDSSDVRRWDQMVAYWLLNSMTPDLSSSFIYTFSSWLMDRNFKEV